MPIDEIVFAVSCSATVTDEFELQLTKTGDKARNWMTMFHTVSDQSTILKRAFAHSRVSGTKLKTHFLKLMKRWRKWAGKPILECFKMKLRKHGWALAPYYKRALEFRPPSDKGLVRSWCALYEKLIIFAPPPPQWKSWIRRAHHRLSLGDKGN